MINVSKENVSIAINPPRVIKDRFVLGDNYHATGPEGICVRITPSIRNVPDGYIYITQFCEYHRIEIDFAHEFVDRPRKDFRMVLDDAWYADERYTGPGDGHYDILRVKDNALYPVSDHYHRDNSGIQHHEYQIGSKSVEDIVFYDAPVRELRSNWSRVDYAIKFKTVLQYSSGARPSTNLSTFMSFNWGFWGLVVNDNQWEFKEEPDWTKENAILDEMSFLPCHGFDPSDYPRIGYAFKNAWYKFIRENT